MMFSRKPTGYGSLTTQTPTHHPVTKQFRQGMVFISRGPAIDGTAIKGIIDHAARLFKGSLLSNGLTDYAWPPDFVEAYPHKDFRGADIVLMTRADHSKPTVLHS
jgi:hypothetical protein